MRRVLLWCAIGGLLLVMATQAHLPARDVHQDGAAATSSSLVSPSEHLAAPAAPGRASTVGLIILASMLLVVLLGVGRPNWLRVAPHDPPRVTHPRVARWRALLLGAPPVVA